MIYVIWWLFLLGVWGICVYVADAGGKVILVIPFFVILQSLLDALIKVQSSNRRVKEGL